MRSSDILNSFLFFFLQYGFSPSVFYLKYNYIKMIFVNIIIEYFR